MAPFIVSSKRHRWSDADADPERHFSSFCSGPVGLWQSRCLGFRDFFLFPLLFCYPTYFTGKFQKFFFFLEQRPNAETFSFIDVKLFNSSSWVETLSKLTSFLSSPCHLLCNLFLGHFPDAPAGLQLCRVTISFPFLHADVIESRKCGFLQN